MSGTKVKICGITTVADARLAHAAGADYLGLIFAESPRSIALDVAQEVRAAVPRAMLVGVFRNQTIEYVSATVTASDVDLLQLHGDESPEYCQSLIAATGKPIIKTFRAGHIPDVASLGAYHNTSFFLFDLEKNGKHGDAVVATMENMWNDACRTRRQGFRVFLAGALTPDNVREAIRRTDVYCVDVCRGVESAPGHKDEASLRRFIKEART